MASHQPKEGTVLPCIVCDKPMEPVHRGKHVINQPYRGTVFTSHGHYGSTVFDPMVSNELLEITICDECLTEARHKRKVLFSTRVIKSEDNYRYWEGENDRYWRGEND